VCDGNCHVSGDDELLIVVWFIFLFIGLLACLCSTMAEFLDTLNACVAELVSVITEGHANSHKKKPFTISKAFTTGRLRTISTDVVSVYSGISKRVSDISSQYRPVAGRNPFAFHFHAGDLFGRYSLVRGVIDELSAAMEGERSSSGVASVLPSIVGSDITANCARMTSESYIVDVSASQDRSRAIIFPKKGAVGGDAGPYLCAGDAASMYDLMVVFGIVDPVAERRDEIIAALNGYRMLYEFGTGERGVALFDVGFPVESLGCDTVRPPSSWDDRSGENARHDQLVSLLDKRGAIERSVRMYNDAASIVRRMIDRGDIIVPSLASDDLVRIGVHTVSRTSFKVGHGLSELGDGNVARADARKANGPAKRRSAVRKPRATLPKEPASASKSSRGKSSSGTVASKVSRAKGQASVEDALVKKPVSRPRAPRSKAKPPASKTSTKPKPDTAAASSNASGRAGEPELKRSKNASATPVSAGTETKKTGKATTSSSSAASESVLKRAPSSDAGHDEVSREDDDDEDDNFKDDDDDGDDDDDDDDDDGDSIFAAYAARVGSVSE
jgi:hypothetical protein